MPVADAYFKNSYTFSIRDIPAAYAATAPLIEANALAVIDYLSDFVSWKGTLDFVVQFKAYNFFGEGEATTRGVQSAFPLVADQTHPHTLAASEAFTGIDPNGNAPELGLFFLPNKTGELTTYDTPIYFDASPDGYERPNIPAGMVDFFSVFLHESLHGLGFWSDAQRGLSPTTFDEHTTLRNGQYFFSGDNVRALIGRDLPLDTKATGSRDHYGQDTTGGTSPVDRGAVFEYGNYEQNRWHLGQIDLAVLRDLGYTTANESKLPLVEQPDPTGPVVVPAWAADAASIEVVASTYQFFTDRIPTADGFAYLISSAANSNDLNDAYYARFNTENRFINFASNLGTAGEGASSFDARFGSLNFEQTVKAVYLEVMGSDLTGAALDFFLNAETFYRAVALERVVRPGVDLAEATKIVAVGSLLNEANKLGSGTYADAIEGLVADVAPDGLSTLLGGDLFAVA